MFEIIKDPALVDYTRVGTVNLLHARTFTLRKKYLYSDFFWSVFSLIGTEYGEMRIISPYWVRMRENAHQKNPEYGHFHAVLIIGPVVYWFKRLNEEIRYLTNDKRKISASMLIDTW